MSPSKGNKELSKAAARMRRKRDAESEADTKERKQKNAARMRRKRDVESEADTKERQQKDDARAKLKRESETFEETEQRLKSQYERTTINSEHETFEQTERRLKQEYERTTVNREHETFEETEQRLKQEYERTTVNRELETLEQTEERHQLDYLRAILNLETETPEEHQQRLHKMKERANEQRASETSEQNKERLRNEYERTTLNREHETPDQITERLQMEYERTTLNREQETPDQNEERLHTVYEQTAVSRENEGPEQQQQRQKKDRASKRDSAKIKKKRERRKPPVKPKSEELIDPDEVPDIAHFVETTESLKCAFEHLMKTRVKEDEHIHASPGINFPLRGLCHQANVCVCCDRFITGTDEVRWISKRNLLVNQERLIDEELPEGLKDCYKVFDPALQHLLISPRARVNVREEYMCCSQFSDSLRPHRKKKLPPKFAISNRWAIGSLPPEILELLTEVTSPLISPVRPSAYVMSFTGGAHKSITGAFTFF